MLNPFSSSKTNFLAETLAYNLKKDGYAVETVGDGLSALEAARRLKPDLIILDIMFPRWTASSGAHPRKELTTAILMLTARDDEIDRVVGLEVGADDYLTKPFSMRDCWHASKPSCGARACCAKKWEKQMATPLPARNFNIR